MLIIHLAAWWEEWDLVTLVGPFHMGLSCDPKKDEETNTEPRLRKAHTITWPQRVCPPACFTPQPEAPRAPTRVVLPPQ